MFSLFVIDDCCLWYLRLCFDYVVCGLKGLGTCLFSFGIICFVMFCMFVLIAGFICLWCVGLLFVLILLVWMFGMLVVLVVVSLVICVD